MLLAALIERKGEKNYKKETKEDTQPLCASMYVLSSPSLKSLLLAAPETHIVVVWLSPF